MSIYRAAGWGRHVPSSAALTLSTPCAAVLTLSPLVSEDTCEAGEKAAEIRGGVEEANDSHNGVARRRLASGGPGRCVPSPSCAAGVALSPLVTEDTGEARDDRGGEARGDRRGCRRRREKREGSAARGEDRSGSGVGAAVASLARPRTGRREGSTASTLVGKDGNGGGEEDGEGVGEDQWRWRC
uniref:Uncharacterized protein n=1 Tax=Oryza meridionalis TaxID=40149 RepID=A0A0E0ESK3_9ORYZ